MFLSIALNIKATGQVRYWPTNCSENIYYLIFITHFFHCLFKRSFPQSGLLTACLCNTSSSYLIGAPRIRSSCDLIDMFALRLLCEYLAAGQPPSDGRDPGYRALIVLACGMGCMLGAPRGTMQPPTSPLGLLSAWEEEEGLLRSHRSYLSDFSTLPPSTPLPGRLFYTGFMWAFFKLPFFVAAPFAHLSPKWLYRWQPVRSILTRAGWYDPKNLQYSVF